MSSFVLLRDIYLIVTIEFESITFVNDGYSYHQTKTPIDYWYGRDLNTGLLLDGKRLYQLI